jgi:hypothetical protein
MIRAIAAFSIACAAEALALGIGLGAFVVWIKVTTGV